MKKLYKFVKKNIFSFLCLFLAFAVSITGGISYSKYLSMDTVSKGSSASTFSFSASVDGVSALSFTNTAFWGGTVGDDQIAMNALRTIDFTVNNFNFVGDVKKICEVKSDYSLVFLAPKNFAEKLAIQLHDSDSNPLTPQIVISDLISKAGSTYNTADSKDYTSTPTVDESFSVTESEIGGCKVYTATSGDTSITIEEANRTVSQTLLFRMWDTSMITNETNKTVNVEGGKLLPPLTVEYEKQATCYRISISQGNFVLPASQETTRKYKLSLAPTHTIEDTELGGYFIEGDSLVKSLYADDSKIWTLKTNHESYVDVIDGVTNSWSQTVIGNFKTYMPGNTYVDETTNTTISENYVRETGSSTSSAVSNEYVYFDENWLQVNDENSATYRINKSGGSANKIITPCLVGRLTKVAITTETVDVNSSEQSVIGGKTIENLDLDVTTVYKTNYNLVGKVSNLISWDFTNATITVQKKEGGSWTTLDPTHEEYRAKFSVVAVGSSDRSETWSETSTVDMDRKITRTTATSEIKINNAYTIDEGATEPTLYTSSAPLNLFDSNSIQKYFISQAYSKNYPFSVNVLFEQVQ